MKKFVTLCTIGLLFSSHVSARSLKNTVLENRVAKVIANIYSDKKNVVGGAIITTLLTANGLRKEYGQGKLGLALASSGVFLTATPIVHYGRRGVAALHAKLPVRKLINTAASSDELDDASSQNNHSNSINALAQTLNTPLKDGASATAHNTAVTANDDSSHDENAQSTGDQQDNGALVQDATALENSDNLSNDNNTSVNTTSELEENSDGNNDNQ